MKTIAKRSDNSIIRNKRNKAHKKKKKDKERKLLAGKEGAILQQDRQADKI